MIKNEKQYKYTKKWIKRFENEINAYEQDEASKQADPVNWQYNRQTLQYHLDALLEEIKEYEALINCDRTEPITIKVKTLNQLPLALIKARLAAKLTYKDLAERLGIEEERVYQYENSDYQCASFVELINVAEVLAVEIETAFVRVDFAAIKERSQNTMKVPV